MLPFNFPCTGILFGNCSQQVKFSPFHRNWWICLSAYKMLSLVLLFCGKLLDSTHVRSWRIPTGVGSAHPFICDPKSVCNCNCIICLRNPAADVQLRSLCPLFHCQEKLVSIVICRRCLSWQNEIIRWKLSQGVWVIIFRWTKGSGRLCNTCRFPEWVVGRFLFLIVLYRVWYLHLRVLQCLILPGVDMRL